ncbi:MAG: hypothetical protein V1660_00345 [archaeon]
MAVMNFQFFAILLGSIIFSIAIHLALSAWVRKAESDIGKKLLKETIKILYALIISIGLYFALKSSPIFSSNSFIFDTAFPIVFVFIIALLVGQLLHSADPHSNKDKE